MAMRIGELAKKEGCQVVTIRYYEKEGLLPIPERTDSNYRLYDEAAAERLAFILHCRRHGIKLSEIRDLLRYRDKPGGDCAWVSALLDGHIAELDQQIHSLVQLRASLCELRSRCGGGNTADSCGILQCLANSDMCGCCLHAAEEDRACGGTPRTAERARRAARLAKERRT